ncbi:MAG: response regulator transcription factor [Acidobacteria bacterium]|nr:response regulator transcription factor [Acidobacteriota bacterium]
MECVILEDEIPAVRRLQSLLSQLDPPCTVRAILGSLREACAYFHTHPEPDFFLFDIQLGDGQSFDLFQDFQFRAPVIFTTAFDQFWMQALENNGCHYLLKPVELEKLQAAVNKVERWFGSSEPIQPKPTKGQRILVQKGMDFLALDPEKIAYFWSEHKITFVRGLDGTRYMTDFNLKDLESQLDPSLFFRLNRQYLIHIQSVQRFRPAEKGRLWVFLAPDPGEPIGVTQERAGRFKEWSLGR